MARTLTPEDLTAHLTDEQRQTLRDGIDAAGRVADAMARELPAIVRAVHIAEANRLTDSTGHDLEAWWEATDAGEVTHRIGDCAEVLELAQGRLDTDAGPEDIAAELVARLNR